MPALVNEVARPDRDQVVVHDLRREACAGLQDVPVESADSGIKKSLCRSRYVPPARVACY